MKRCFCITFLFMSACAQVPTKVIETSKRELQQVYAKAQKPLELKDDSVVLDARASFDYGLNHVQNSQSFLWTTLAEDSRTGEVLRDKHQAALRLALRGLKTTTPIIVVGYGPSGQGEEGRLAWTLLYLGFQDVQISGIENLRKALTQQPSPPPQNIPPYRLNPRDEMQISRLEFEGLKAHGPDLFILDVRSPAEIKKQPHEAYAPLAWEWSKLFTEQGRPDVRAKKRLETLGVTPASKIIVVSNRGVRSAAAAYALLALGFVNVQNFTAGWNAL